MTDPRTSLHGLWLPLITPFRHGELDETSLRRMVRHYTAFAVNGMILAATTGESLTLTLAETERLVRTARDEAGKTRNLPLLLGLSGSNTRALLDMLERTAAWAIDGYLISCPYYSRPSQQGMRLHFEALADRARHPVMLYNIPYRTGVNLGNAAMLQLADHPNILGCKDCCADRGQSLELLRRRPRKTSPCLPARMRNVMKRWSMVPTAAFWPPRISKPKPSRKYAGCWLRAKATPRCNGGGRSPISPGCCSPSLVRRRSSTGCGAAA